MELQKWEPAKPGSQPLSVGEAIKGRKLKDTPESDIKQVLRLIMLKLGIRAANLPTDEEKAVLISHIYSNYSGHTLKEIQLAFEMAIAGRLEVEVNCFENFSCIYFSGIMTAYRKFASEQVKQIPSKPKQIENKEEVTEEEILDLAKKYAEFDWRLIPVRAYTILYNQGHKPTEEHRLEILRSVEIALQEMEQKDPGLYSGTTREDFKLGLCKKMAVRDYI